VDPNGQRRGWVVVFGLFVTLFLVFGSGYNTAGVFFTPVLRYFGWSRTRLSSLQTVLAATAGLSLPVAGWLLDKVQARFVIGAGAALVGCGFVVASAAHSFGAMALAYALVGLGIASGTLLPCATVLARWFDERRGLALGIAMSGTAIGGMVMTLVAELAIEHRGWRAGYLALAIPMFAIVIPLVLAAVRAAPKEGSPARQQAPGGEGLEVGQALRARSFWLICVIQFCNTFASSGATLHAVPYLIGIGYRAATAAFVLSATFGLAAAGKLGLGWLGDRIGGRPALALTLLLAAAGQALLLGASRPVLLLLYTFLYGLASGAPLALVPMVVADSLGLRRFGSLTALSALLGTVGAASGPVAAGWIFDLRASYWDAFELFAAAYLLGSIAALACSPLAQLESDENLVRRPIEKRS
jgi:MFS family permease